MLLSGLLVPALLAAEVLVVDAIDVVTSMLWELLVVELPTLDVETLLSTLLVGVPPITTVSAAVPVPRLV